MHFRKPLRSHHPRQATTRRSETPTLVSELSQSAAVKLPSARNCKLPTCGGVTHRPRFANPQPRRGCIDLGGYGSSATRRGESDLCRKRQHACALQRRTPKQLNVGFARSLSIGSPHLRAQAKTLGFTEKAKEISKPVLSRLASVDNASDSTTGLRAPTLVTNEIWLRAQEYPS